MIVYKTRYLFYTIRTQEGCDFIKNGKAIMNIPPDIAHLDLFN